jgi:hypothetical protein
MFSTLRLSVAKLAVSLGSPALAILVALPTPASAEIVFSNFGPGNSYDVDAAWVVAGPTSEAPDRPSAWAFGFTPSGNFALTQIDIAMSNSSAPISVTVSLDQATGGLPGATIESWTLTSLPVFPPDPGAVQTVVPVSTVPLDSGTEYWLVATAAGETIDSWNVALGGPNAPAALDTGSGWALQPPLNEPFGAFDVQGNAIPESSTWAMMLLGFAALGFVGYRQTRGVKPRTTWSLGGRLEACSGPRRLRGPFFMNPCAPQLAALADPRAVDGGQRTRRTGR